MVFVVKVLRWTMKFPYPLGITVGALPCGGCVYSGDLLLKVAHHIPKDECSSQPKIPAVSQNPAHQFKDVITIDPQGSKDHDDALSCVLVKTRRDGTHDYEIGVHITDVQKFVPRGTQLDIAARQKGTSVYSSTSQCVSHMLPDQLVQAASITPGQPRDAFSVVAQVSVKERKVVGKIHSIRFLKSQIVSSKELTYEQAQTSILAAKGSRPIKTLWAVASHHRQRRLGQSAAAHIRMRRADEMLCPEAHMLVEELMVWANQEVANYLLEFSPAILRHQPAPNEDELKALISVHGQHMSVSPDLRQHIPVDQRVYVAVQMLQETVREMEEDLKNGHVRRALHKVQFEHLQPQVAVAHALYSQICQPSSYCIAENVEDFRHDGLQCDQYTRFTSPIRRYIDLVVQRMLNSALTDQPNPYGDEPDELEAICRDMKERERIVSRYEDDRRNLELGCELQQSSREYTCFVKKIEDGELFTVFHDPSLKLGPVAIIPLKHLNAKKIPQKESSPEPDSTDSAHPQHCVWQVKMTAGNTKPKSFLSNAFLQPDSRNKAAAQIVFFTPDQPDKLETSTLQECTVNASIKPLTCDIPKENWERLQTYALSHPTNADTVRKLLPNTSLQQDSKFPTITHSPLWVYRFHGPLQTCQVLRVQLTGCFNSTKQMVTPAVQLVEVGPNLRVCIQHNSNPTECFTDASLNKAPKSGHISLKRYFQFWEQALLAEAATASITDAELLMIRDVKVVWPELKEVTDSQGQVFYQLPAAEHHDRPENCAYVKLSKSFMSSSYEFFHIDSGDLVCLRYCEGGRSDGVRGVLHMVVSSTTKKKTKEEDEVSEINVYLKFVGERPNYISRSMKAALSNLSYEIQLIPLSLPLRRIYNCLMNLHKPHSSGLSSHIALGQARCDNSAPKRIDKVLTKDQAKVATTLWTDKPNPAKLNGYQQKAIELACSRQFVMIQGPPGTGKSVTGAHIAYALAMKLRKEVGKVRKKEGELNQCVMYCGPSQQSVNVVLDILISSADVRDSGLKIVRVYSNAIESQDFQGPKFNPLVFSPLKVDGKCEKKFKQYALHHLVRKKRPDIVSFDEEFEQLKAAKKVPGPSKRDAYRKAVTSTSIEVLKQDVDIVLCTCNEAGSYRITQSVSPTYCIIDECAMATEPECMVAIRRAQNVVLIGDDKQLQPVIQNRDAARMGMGTSLFERYCRAGTVPHMLKTQYRMHRALCLFPSEEFYEGQLETDPSVQKKYNKLLDRLADFWPQGRDSPLVFCDIIGEEEENHTGHRGSTRVGLESKRNTMEANKIVEMVKTLKGYGVSEEEMAAITPYSAQKEEIKKQLERAHIEGVTVKTITDAQGSEFGIVLLSTVRTQPMSSLRTANGERKKTDFGWTREHLGFITDRHQICVGLTRCKYGLVIVGNVKLLSHDPTWEALIYHCQRKGCLVDGKEFPSK